MFITVQCALYFLFIFHMCWYYKQNYNLLTNRSMKSHIMMHKENRNDKLACCTMPSVDNKAQNTAFLHSAC